MRTSSNILKSLKSTCRAPSNQVVAYSRPDLTKKWMNRVQAKVKDSNSQEAFFKLSSLIDYYNKPSTQFKEDINWNYWGENIRSNGLVEKIKSKYEEFKLQGYNIDNIAQRSTINSEKFDNYGLYLKWNYYLWMRQYLENIKTLNGLDALGDINYVSAHEMFLYTPGIRELSAGWRETGNYLRTPHYFENSITTVISRQFRYSNKSWLPYWHSTYAWERGIQIKHVLMSL